MEHKYSSILLLELKFDSAHLATHKFFYYVEQFHMRFS